MKKHWVKLWDLAFKEAGKKGVSYDQKQYYRAEQIYKYLFLKHRN